MYLPLYYHVGVFILRARRPKHDSSLRRVFWLRASKIKTSTQQRVQTERRVISMVLAFRVSFGRLFVQNCRGKPVLITSLSV